MKILLNNIKECFTKILKKSDFGKTSIAIIVALDVDAIAALRILRVLLNRENLQFRVLPVTGYKEMQDAIAICGTQYRSVIFLNCGSIYDMNSQRPQDTKYYIFDSHQPVHHANVNSNKIYVIDDGMGILDKCPDRDYEDVSDLSSSEEEDQNEPHSPTKQQSKLRKEAKKIKLRANQLHLEYYDGHFYSRPAACVLYRLALQLNHDCNDLLWYAILGLTDSYVHLKLNQKNYQIILLELQNEVLRLNGIKSEINQENEYKLLLLRQQSLYNSMYYSTYIGSKLRLWQDKESNSQLYDFIVRLGIPLAEAHQKYAYMQLKFKNLLKENIVEVAQKFNMDDIIYPSFTRTMDAVQSISATDLVHAVTAILEYPPDLLDKYIQQYQSSDVVTKLRNLDNSSKAQNFWCAFDTIDMYLEFLISKSSNLFEQGVNMAIEFQESVVTVANELREKKDVSPTKHFRYAIIKTAKKFFQNSASLAKLGLLLMEIYKEQAYKKTFNKPIILCNQIHGSDKYLVLAVVGGMGFGTEKNQFGNYFLKVVNDLQLSYRQDSFETSVIEIDKEDFPAFLDELLNYQQ